MGLSVIGYLVIGLFATAAVFLALRSPMRAAHTRANAAAAKSHPSEKPASRKSNPYRATAIVGSKNICSAAGAIIEKRFLVADKDIPQLPLLDCDAAHCACTYKHYEDRRDNHGDRRGPRGLHSELHRYIGQLERRMRRGRRVMDWV